MYVQLEHNSTLSWQEASELCQNTFDSNLVKINTKEELELLNYWTGELLQQFDYILVDAKCTSPYVSITSKHQIEL